jgi:hypothetical protein
VGAFGSFLLVNRLIVKGRIAAKGRPAREFRARVTLAETAMIPAVVGAILLLCATRSGFDWIAAGVVLQLVVGVFDGWILLVEILR